MSKKTERPKLRVRLAAVGKPDMKQFYGLGVAAPTEIREVKTLKAASKACEKYLRDWDLGAGNWVGGQIANEQGEQIARVSYNGRIWPVEQPGVEELDRRLNAVLQALHPTPKARAEALCDIHWVITDGLGGYAMLEGRNQWVADVEKATVFSGFDNPKLKLAFVRSICDRPVSVMVMKEPEWGGKDRHKNLGAG
jgi:hypothetical protein